MRVLWLEFVLALPAAAAAQTCASGLNSPCHESGCCAEPSLACYKRAGKDYAQCRPRQRDCVDTETWLCPGWELCGTHLGSCSKSACCQHPGDVCYQKGANSQYHTFNADCLPKGSCAGRKDPETQLPWLCSNLHEPSTCSSKWQECTSTKCCATPGFTCFEQQPGNARCMPTCPDPAEPATSYTCKIHDRAQVEAKTLLPVDPIQSTCSRKRTPCTETACCADSDFTCYSKGAHFAMCLPSGACRKQWPDETSATCQVRSPPDVCSASHADCSATTCCSDPSFKCFQKEPLGQARCMRGCNPSSAGLEGWACNVLGVAPPPAPPNPPPAPFSRSTYDFTCAAFKDRASIHAAACATLTDAASCNTHFRQSAAVPIHSDRQVLEPCVWWHDGVCAVGTPIECSSAQIAYEPKVVVTNEDAMAAAAAQGAADPSAVFTSLLAKVHAAPKISQQPACSRKRTACTDTGCCVDGETFTCYAKSKGFAMCLPIGDCRKQWPDAKSATCEVYTKPVGGGAAPHRAYPAGAGHSTAGTSGSTGGGGGVGVGTIFLVMILVAALVVLGAMVVSKKRASKRVAMSSSPRRGEATPPAEPSEHPSWDADGVGELEMGAKKGKGKVKSKTKKTPGKPKKGVEALASLGEVEDDDL